MSVVQFPARITDEAAEAATQGFERTERYRKVEQTVEAALGRLQALGATFDDLDDVRTGLFDAAVYSATYAAKRALSMRV